MPDRKLWDQILDKLGRDLIPDELRRWFGESTAVVTGWLIVTGRAKSGAFTRRFRFTDTWVKLSGAWQIVAAQDYLAK